MPLDGDHRNSPLKRRIKSSAAESGPSFRSCEDCFWITRYRQLGDRVSTPTSEAPSSTGPCDAALIQVSLQFQNAIKATFFRNYGNLFSPTIKRTRRLIKYPPNAKHFSQPKRPLCVRRAWFNFDQDEPGVEPILRNARCAQPRARCRWHARCSASLTFTRRNLGLIRRFP